MRPLLVVRRAGCRALLVLPALQPVDGCSRRLPPAVVLAAILAALLLLLLLRWRLAGWLPRPTLPRVPRLLPAILRAESQRLHPWLALRAAALVSERRPAGRGPGPTPAGAACAPLGPRLLLRLLLRLCQAQAL